MIAFLWSIFVRVVILYRSDVNESISEKECLTLQEAKTKETEWIYFPLCTPGPNRKSPRTFPRLKLEAQRRRSTFPVPGVLLSLEIIVTEHICLLLLTGEIKTQVTNIISVNEYLIDVCYFFTMWLLMLKVPPHQMSTLFADSK